ncbi:MAG: diguanylate cyclase [candidate division Zixibacteria bacterium]|nr:diguanylate cyclase [candidate division Zixibacteria bacterium]
MGIERLNRKLKRIGLFILVLAAVLAAILILGSLPEIRQTLAGRLLLPVAGVLGLCIAGLAMYLYYSTRYKIKPISPEERELFEGILRWNKPGFIEPLELVRMDFRQLEKILKSPRGVLYIDEDYELIPIASFGTMQTKPSKIHLTDDSYDYWGNIEKLCPLTGEIKNLFYWGAEYGIAFRSPSGITAVAVFGEVEMFSESGFKSEIFQMIINRIALELDYTVSRFKFLQSRRKIKELYNENSSLRRDLKRKVYDINAIFKESSNLYTILSENKLLNSFMLMIVGQLAIKSAAIFCKDAETGYYTPKYWRGVPKEDVKKLKFDSRGSLIQNLHSLSRPTTIEELEGALEDDPEFYKLKESGVRAISKINAAGSTFGYLLTGEKSNEDKYRKAELKMISILVNIASSALENIQNYRIIEELSFTDSMTGLYNYRYFYKRLNEEIFRAKRYFRSLALVIFDIDDFKSYNDNYGHQAGDAVLKQLGSYLRKAVRAIDVVCRYGGEEFCVIMQETTDAEVRTFISRLRTRIARHKFESEFLERSQNITVSVGAAIYPADADTPDKLIYCADMAMLKAKSDGKNIGRMYSDISRNGRENIEIAGTDE